jgi:signal transduction histidine kinase
VRLKGSNNDGVWNETGTSLGITIIPPLWETWWFRGIILLVLLGGTYGGYRLRVRNLEVRGQELESQVEQRTAELMQIEEALRQSEMEKAISSERSRLARDLHDSVTQTIFSMTLTTEATRQLLERDPSRLLSQLDRLQELSKSALAEMRSLIFELRPTTVSEVGLVPALRQHFRSIEKQNALSVSFDVVGEPDITGDRAERLFRIIQEALNNVVKHAQVDQASVTVRFEDEVTSISIEDQGLGFNPEAVDTNNKQMGLSSMRERADMLGGTLSIDSQPGKGTSVKVLIPLTKNRGAENG